MIPYNIVGKTTYRAYGTFFLIVISALFFMWEIGISSSRGVPMEQLFGDYALVTCAVGETSFAETMIDGARSLFMHSTFLQFMLNMLFLWIFAPRVEEFFGHMKFILLFFLAGFGGHVGSILTSGGECATLLGPEGAIAGVLAMFMILFPSKQVTAGVPLISRTFTLPAIFFIVVYLGIQIFSTEGGPLSGNVLPIWDEVGGFITGLILIFVATMFKPAPPVDPFESLDD